MIWFTSDLHFCHDKDFIYGPRGFTSVSESNDTIVKNWNEIIAEDDDVYVLGDIFLNDAENGAAFLKMLKGNIHIVRGNHDTDKKWELISKCNNVCEMTTVIYPLRYKKWRFYLSHFPTFTSSGDELLADKSPRQCLINLFGHTHQKEKFFHGNPCMYNVGLDAHNNKPVSIEKIIEDIKKQTEEIREKFSKLEED